jgi:hypothetical protein
MLMNIRKDPQEWWYFDTKADGECPDAALEAVRSELRNSGRWIWTSDLRDMNPPEYLAIPSRYHSLDSRRQYE